MRNIMLEIRAERDVLRTESDTIPVKNKEYLLDLIDA